jgi:hypothetical protein
MVWWHLLTCSALCAKFSADNRILTLKCCLAAWMLFQGSTDMSHWVDLRRHSGDTTLKLPGQYGSWQVTGPTAAMPFRAFRVKLTGEQGALLSHA